MVRTVLFGVLLFLLGGCAVIPVPLTSEEIKEQAEKDKAQLTKDQEAVTGPISLYEAIARALSYNLDLRLELAKKVLSERELDLTRYEQLPDFVASSAYNGRSNFSGATSRSLLTGTQSLESSTSSERDIFTHNLNLTWSILDFGVSYFRAQQAADRVLITEEQKRKIINNIIQDVRTAYWRAVSNDRLILQMESLIIRVKDAIKESKQIEYEKLEKPLTALTYQRELIGIKRELEELQRELSLAKIQLASLMNLRPNQDYELVIPERTNEIRTLGYTPQLMEQLALENRSELREVTYQKRINSKEIKTAMLELLPGINLNMGGSNSSNDFLFNNDWLTYGAQISWNLLNVFKLPATKRVIKAQELLLDARRMALSMAILTQINVSIAQHEHAKKEYRTAADYHKTQQDILEQIRLSEQAKSISEQAVIREEMNALVADVKYDIAYADLENAYANAYAAVGTDPLSIDANLSDLEELTDSIRQHFESISQNNLDFSMRFDSVSKINDSGSVFY